MSPLTIITSAITHEGRYVVGYIADGGTHETIISCHNANEAMIRLQDKINLASVTFVERE